MTDVRKKVMHWMWDCRPSLPDAVEDRVNLDRLVGRACCVVWGHEPIADNCAKPEHDFCAWCQKLMPGQAKSIGKVS